MSKSFHFSVDDVFTALYEVSEYPTDIFKNPFFAYLRELHLHFGAIANLYLFQEHEINGVRRTLDDISSDLRPTFQDQEHSWIRFGPHALNTETPPHAQNLSEQQSVCAATYANIERFAGPNRTSDWVRLHFFSECYELAPLLHARGVDTILTTDKPAVSYRLPPPQKSQLESEQQVGFRGIDFRRSHVRTENLVGCTPQQFVSTLEESCPDKVPVVVFTHEYELERREVRDMTSRVLAWIRTRAD